MVEFVWHPSTDRPRKPPVIHKDLADISHTSRVMADFIPNFVAMATELVTVDFVWPHLIAQPTKNPCYTQGSRGYLLYKPSCGRF